MIQIKKFSMDIYKSDNSVNIEIDCDLQTAIAIQSLVADLLEKSIENPQTSNSNN